jgi:hypothetical protein
MTTLWLRLGRSPFTAQHSWRIYDRGPGRFHTAGHIV